MTLLYSISGLIESTAVARKKAFLAPFFGFDLRLFLGAALLPLALLATVYYKEKGEIK